MSAHGGWVGVDFDGTLAQYDGWKGPEHMGAPVPPMVARVRGWLARGVKVKILTARADDARMVALIQGWCREHVGETLEVTNQKDFGMIELWDDRVVQVEANTGRPAPGSRSRVDALGDGCTGFAATWCPVHGRCSCAGDPLDATGTDAACPLHGEATLHAVPV